MISRLLLGPYRLTEPWIQHRNWIVRRIAEITALGVAMIWLALPGSKKAEGDSWGNDELARQLSSSPQLREFLHGRAIANPFIGPLCRALIRRLSFHAKIHKPASCDGRNFVLQLEGPIDQRVLRNLRLWQKHVLPSYLRGDKSEVHIALVLRRRSDGEARLFDLFSAVLVLERLRSLAVFWDREAAAPVAPILMSERELLPQRAERDSDLGNMPWDIARQVELHEIGRASCRERR